MRFRYYRETDSLYIDLANRPSVDSREVAPGVVIDLDEDGNLTGIDIDHASRITDPTLLESSAVPPSYAREQTGAASRVREPAPAPEGGEGPAYEVFKDSSGRYRWRLRTADGEIVAASAGDYPTRGECRETIRAIQHALAAERVEEVPS